jgi:hypothetical protein
MTIPLILFLIFLGVFIFYHVDKQYMIKEKLLSFERKEKVKKEKTFISSSNFEEMRAIFVPLFAFLLIIFGLALIANWSAGDFKPKQTKVVETPKKAPTVKKQVQYATLSWEKPAGVRGGNPYLRSYSTKAVVHKISNDLMEFTVVYKYNGESYKSRFMWDKSKKYGEWSQNSPYDYGEWFLLPTNNPRVFVGKISDQSGIFIPLRLELS